MSLTAARELRDAMKVCLSSVAGSEYNELKYLSPGSLDKNAFNGGHDKRYGIRPSFSSRNLEAETTKHLTYTQSFEFVLTKGFCTDGVSDTDQYEAYLDLHELALGFTRKVIQTKAGVPSVTMNSINFSIEGPVFLEDKVAVLTGNIDIIYRLTL